MKKWFKENKLEITFTLALIASVGVFFLPNSCPTIDQITPLQEVQEVRKCYSPFDIYMTDSYEIVDDNKTLITSHGRVYNLADCNLLKDN